MDNQPNTMLMEKLIEQAQLLGEIKTDTKNLKESFEDFRENEFKPLNHLVRNHAITDEKLQIFMRDHLAKIIIAILKKWKWFLGIIGAIIVFLGTLTIDFGDRLIRIETEKTITETKFKN